MNTKPKHLDLTEKELVKAAQDGDSAAFRAIYDRYQEPIYNLIYYLLNDSLLVEDVLQNVFIKVYRALKTFRFEASLATWIYRIAVNECQNQNQRNNAQYVPLEAILGSDKELDNNLLPDEQQTHSQRQEIIHQTIMTLPPKLRAAVVLKYLEDLNYAEIGAILECSPGTVASRLNRALLQLEERLKPFRRLL
ncbi:MAG: sigma-70 family RNA polymerase sigma factor [Acidobacteriota bacterium]